MVIDTLLIINIITVIRVLAKVLAKREHGVKVTPWGDKIRTIDFLLKQTLVEHEGNRERELACCLLIVCHTYFQWTHFV